MEPRGRNATGAVPSSPMSASYDSATAAGDTAVSTQRRPASPIATRRAAIGEQFPYGRRELLGVVRGDADSRAGLGQQAGDRCAGVDGREDRPPGGEDRVCLRRHAHAGQSGTQGHDVEVARGEQFGEPLRRDEAAEPNVRQPRSLPLEVADASSRHRSPGTSRRAVGERRPRAGRATASSRRCRRTTRRVRHRSPAPARYRVIRADGRICSGSTKLGIVCTLWC